MIDFVEISARNAGGFCVLLLTWGHDWIIVGYIGGHFGNIKCQFNQLFKRWQKVRKTCFEQWVLRVSSIEKNV